MIRKLLKELGEDCATLFEAVKEKVWHNPLMMLALIGVEILLLLAMFADMDK